MREARGGPSDNPNAQRRAGTGLPPALGAAQGAAALTGCSPGKPSQAPELGAPGSSLMPPTCTCSADDTDAAGSPYNSPAMPSFNHPDSQMSAKQVWVTVREEKVMGTQCDLNFRSACRNLKLCISPASGLPLFVKNSILRIQFQQAVSLC